MGTQQTCSKISRVTSVHAYESASRASSIAISYWSIDRRGAQALMHEHNNSHLKSLPENRLQPYQNTSLLRVSCSIPVLPISASPFSRPHASELFDIEISQRSRGARHDDLFDPSSS